MATLLGQGRGEIRRAKTFAFTRHGAGEQKRARILALQAAGQRRAQGTERLALRRVVRADQRHPGGPAAFFHLGHGRQQRQAQDAFGLIHRLQSVVEQFEHEGQRQTREPADQRTGEEDLQARRFGRVRWHGGSLDHAQIVERGPLSDPGFFHPREHAFVECPVRLGLTQQRVVRDGDLVEV